MTIYDQLRGLVDSIADRPPYEVQGRVVNEPFGLEYPRPVYDSSMPSVMAPMNAFGLTREDMHLILIGMFFLIAFALVTRK